MKLGSKSLAHPPADRQLLILHSNTTTNKWLYEAWFWLYQ